MKHVVIGDHKAWLEEAPDPTPQGEWVVIKMHVSPICGSDMHAYRAPGAHAGCGHEGCGEVVAVDGAHHLREGDRVLVNPESGCGECWLCRQGDYIHCRSKPPGATGHFAQFVRKQEWLCPKLPEDISYELASLMSCTLSPAYQALWRMQVTAFDSLLVTGLGPVGLGAVALGKFLGAAVIGTDPEPWRRNRALELGADAVLDSTSPDLLARIRDWTGGEGVSRSLDASGHPDAERLCIDAVRPLGKVGFIGGNMGTIPFSPTADGTQRGIEIITAWHQNLNSFPNLITFLRRFSGVGKLISHSFGFSEVDQAFAAFDSRQTAKVLLRPWG